MKSPEVQVIYIGKLLVSDPINSAWHIFPSSSILPGTQEFDIFEKLEAILQNSSTDHSQRDQLSRALSNDLLSNNDEIDVYGEQGVSGVWKIFTLVGKNTVVLLKLGEQTSQSLASKVEKEVVAAPKEEIITLSPQASDPYHLILSTAEWKNLVPPYHNAKLKNKSLRKNMFRKPIFLVKAEVGNSSHFAILFLVVVSTLIVYLGLSL
jgi:hypothetical protein